MSGYLGDVSIGRPLPGHYPIVGRRHSGGGRQGYGRRYQTTLRCECGWLPGFTGLAEGRYTNQPDVASNSAPSQGGRAAAQRAYRAHADEVLTLAEAAGGWRLDLVKSWDPRADGDGMTDTTHPWIVTRGTCRIGMVHENDALDVAHKLVALGHTVSVHDALNPDARTDLRPIEVDR